MSAARPELQSFRLAAPGKARAELFAAWRDVVGDVLDVSASPSEIAAFAGDFSASISARFVLSASRSGDIGLSRSPAAAAGGFDGFAIRLVLDGAIAGQTGEATLAARPGDVTVFDCLQSFAYRPASPDRATCETTLWAPRASILALTPEEGALHGLTLRGDTPPGAVLAAALRALAARAAEATAREFDLLCEGVLALAIKAASPTLEAVAGAPAAPPLASFVTVRRYIDRNLATPGLDANSIARAFGLSRASLYRLFVPAGGVALYVRKARLARAYQEIVALERADRRIGQVAFRLGFRNVSAFNRLFQATYGVSPGEARRRAAQGFPGLAAPPPRASAAIRSAPGSAASPERRARVRGSRGVSAARPICLAGGAPLPWRPRPHSMRALPLSLAFSLRAAADAIAGHVYDRDDPTRRFVVELWLDGAPAATARADRPATDLDEGEAGDRRCGFHLPLPRGSAGALAEARLANLDVSLGLLRIPEETPPPEPGPSGLAQWLGGLRLSGWLPAGDPDVRRSVRARFGGKDVAVADALAYANGEGEARRGFDLYLPVALADGDIHAVDVVDDDGAALDGSPAIMVAFADGLSAYLSKREPLVLEALRGEVFDRLLPQSLPFWQFEGWRQRFPLPARRASRPLALALVGEGAFEATFASLAGDDAGDWVGALLPSAGGGATFAPADLARFLAESAPQAAHVVVAPAGARFLPGGLASLAAALDADPAAALAYADFVAEAPSGQQTPVALPLYSYERMLEQGYAAQLFALPRAVALGAAREGAGDPYALAFAAIGEAGAAARVVRATGFAATLPPPDLAADARRLAIAATAHLARRGVAARATPSEGARLLPAVRIARRGAGPSVSAIIPTRDRLDLLKRCVESIAPALTAVSGELIVVDNGSSEAETLAYLDGLADAGALVIKAPGPFNYSRLNNLAAQRANGEALALLNNDIEALDDGWLEEMLSRLREDDVGAVGAKLLWPSRVVQHGGVTLGLSFGAGHALTEHIDGAPGYADLLVVARETSAVTAACLITRKRHFEAVGGLDEAAFPVNFNDVDYCLKLRRAGLRVVFTPHARLLHHESASRGVDRAGDRALRFSGELRELRDRWSATLADDPCYSPLLSLDARAYTALAWPPRVK